MHPLEQLIRASRAMQLEARRERSRSKTLRAAMRAARLDGRRIVTQSRDARSGVEAGRLLQRLRSGSLPVPPGNQDGRDMKPPARSGQ